MSELISNNASDEDVEPRTHKALHIDIVKENKADKVVEAVAHPLKSPREGPNTEALQSIIICMP